MQRFGESIHYYDKILKKEPKNMKGLVAKAFTLYQYMGRIYDAEEVVDQALVVDPNHELATILKKAIQSRTPKSKFCLLI
jgi:tetratricopeptide (TPR) repeat protein